MEKWRFPMTRRNFLGASIAAGLGAWAGGMIKLPVAQAAAPQVKTQAPGFYRIMVGDYEVTALSDGTATFPMDKLLTNIPVQKTETLLARAYRKPQYEVSMNNYLINTGSGLVLVDTGAGRLFGPKTGGKLVANLKAAGYRPEQIDTVLLTHIHADHSGGLMLDGELVFPNALVHVHRRDADYWLSKTNLDNAPADQKYRFRGAMSSLNPYIEAGKLVTFDSDAELAPGIKAVQSPGHTPGHSFFAVESKGQKLLLWGDIIHVAEVQFTEPSVGIKFDVEPEAAINNRKKIFREAAGEGCLIGASHISFPGLGHVRDDGAEYVWVPLAYSLGI